MIGFSKELARFFFLAAVFFILVQIAKATTMSFTVPAGEEVTKSMRLAVEDHVLIKFTVVGRSSSTLDFCILNPQGDVMVEYRDTGSVSYSFVCGEAGKYVLRFSNDSAEDKFVTLDYEIQHYIFGIPQMLFLTIVIVLVCIGAVAAFVLMGKPY
jgi:hypothetical protein